ncbi:hypothetical protein G6F57_004290 [Rhizopus arrhizus]|uniref:Uncharacterized protein n=1 Tax=Rhizopus oryzae TaxID=64495 RepID=A0A9P7BTG4_RHIOR|nr:hypothetical protein G6F23_002660 [Rhizopus arrhizus]KAG1412573.1 hypothetical protein G6F58_007944 [Rhizopus delemar]KAG0765765.1 hypothetical protein G6F24_004158 [Rhizopus arrhizus]KAG0788234.1 hypothetical protein G6F22_007068 [Rhizopus arrhizus]KAG0797626.1 hypothetical protein G6F21_000386 [Rhizopus arrhizus]
MYSNNNCDAHNELLKEPVAFEDFQFSYGFDSNFALHVEFDMPSAGLDETEIIPPPPPLLPESHASILNEQDQKIFNGFLDQFYADTDMQMDPSVFSLCNQPAHFDEEDLCESFLLHSLEEEKDISKEEGLGCLLNSCSTTRLMDNQINSGLKTSNANHCGEHVILL